MAVRCDPKHGRFLKDKIMNNFCLLLVDGDYKSLEGAKIVSNKTKRRRFKYTESIEGFKILVNGFWYIVDKKDFKKD